jgi:hypothetical protein
MHANGNTKIRTIYTRLITPTNLIEQKTLITHMSRMLLKHYRSQNPWSMGPPTYVLWEYTLHKYDIQLTFSLTNKYFMSMLVSQEAPNILKRKNSATINSKYL